MVANIDEHDPKSRACVKRRHFILPRFPLVGGTGFSLIAMFYVHVSEKDNNVVETF